MDAALKLEAVPRAIRKVRRLLLTQDGRIAGATDTVAKYAWRVRVNGSARVQHISQGDDEALLQAMALSAGDPNVIGSIEKVRLDGTIAWGPHPLRGRAIQALRLAKSAQVDLNGTIIGEVEVLR